MPPTDFFLHLAISQMSFFGIASILFTRKTYEGKLLILFSVSLLGFLFFRLLNLPPHSLSSFLLGRIGFSVTSVLWLIAHAFFSDHQKVSKLAWFFIFFHMVLRGLGSLSYTFFPSLPTMSPVFILFYVLPQLIIFGLCAHVLFLALSNYKDDLVETRRRMRATLVIVMCAFWLIISIDGAFALYFRMIGESIQGYFQLDKIIELIVFPITLIANLILLDLIVNPAGFNQKHSFRTFYPSPKAPAFIDPEDQELVDQICKLMDSDRIFTTSGLTIGQLADQMKTQEYKLRHLINQGMGFNNFSHFLNHYRVKEAEKLLLNTRESIFNIGIDIGYTSLSSFHKAFKQANGMTPKEYRIMHRNLQPAKSEEVNPVNTGEHTSTR